MDRISVGRRGEDFAAWWLQENGLHVVERNWRHGREGEIDLVASDPRTGELVVVEVKTRSGEGYGHPAEAVGASKLLRLHRLAAAYGRSHGEYTHRPRRVDVLALLWPREAACPRSVDHYVGVTP